MENYESSQPAVFSRDDFVALLIKGDHLSCQKAVLSLKAQNMSLEDIYEDILKASLYKIGDLWQEAKVSVAQEHMATAIVESLMSLLIESADFSNQDKKLALMVTLSCEHHRVGVTMISDIMERRGWEVESFTCHEMIDQNLLEAVRTHRPSLVGVSLALRTNIEYLESILSQLQKHDPKLHIMIGGQALQKNDIDLSAYKKAHIVQNIPDLLNCLKLLDK